MEENNPLVKVGKKLETVVNNPDQDKLLKELSYTKRELILAKQKLQ